MLSLIQVVYLEKPRKVLLLILSKDQSQECILKTQGVLSLIQIVYSEKAQEGASPHSL